MTAEFNLFVSGPHQRPIALVEGKTFTRDADQVPQIVRMGTDIGGRVTMPKR